ncbi:hypothetical protein diail_3397 [Diaporthe ilicicola]|nr:hypothetical protein diail_3397 [Diaporthe ilicicola]
MATDSGMDEDHDVAGDTNMMVGSDATVDGNAPICTDAALPIKTTNASNMASISVATQPTDMIHENEEHEDKASSDGKVSTVQKDKNTANGLTFLHLPAEIRNDVYRYALVAKDGRGKSSILDLVQPPLACTNKQIRSEALDIYYGKNIFLLDIPRLLGETGLKEWTDFISMPGMFQAGGAAGSMQRIQTIILRLSYECPTDCGDLHVWLTFTALPEFHRLHRRNDRSITGDFAWDDRDAVYECIELGIGMAHSAMIGPDCLDRFVTTIVAVAKACPGVTKYAAIRHGTHIFRGGGPCELGSDHAYVKLPAARLSDVQSRNAYDARTYVQRLHWVPAEARP